MEKLCEGPHVHADFQPARFVARLQGILLPNTGRDESVANFCFNYIFEFSTESARTDIRRRSCDVRLYTPKTDIRQRAREVY